MEAFQFSQAKTLNSALEAGRSQTETKFVAGGTTLIDLMKLNVETPKRVVDINSLPLTQIEPTPDGGLKIGAMVRNSDLAHDQTVQQRYNRREFASTDPLLLFSRYCLPVQ
jgi:xanthine dehydrogenase YagS FAD-binding subunit